MWREMRRWTARLLPGPPLRLGGGAGGTLRSGVTSSAKRASSARFSSTGSCQDDAVELHVGVVVAVERAHCPRCSAARSPARMVKLSSSCHGVATCTSARSRWMAGVRKCASSRATSMLQGLEGAEEQRVSLEAVQPHGGVRIDVLEGARDHLQAGVVDLVIGQPLHEDARPASAPAGSARRIPACRDCRCRRAWDRGYRPTPRRTCAA